MRGLAPTLADWAFAKTDAPPLDASLPKSSFWQRRVLEPIRTVFTQGVTPDRVALTIAVATACSLLPFLGLTTVLNLVVGLCLKMNQPIMQALNYLLGPVQVAMIVIYVRMGEKIWRAPAIPISISELLKSFRAHPWEFIQTFGWTGIHAATAWLLSVPIIISVLYYGTRPLLRRFHQRQKT